MPAADATIVVCPLREVSNEQLRDEIAAATGRPAPYVDVYEDRIEVVGDMAGVEKTAAATVAAHSPAPPPPTREERIEAIVQNASSWQEAVTALATERLL